MNHKPKIKNTTDLQAEISRLKAVIHEKEQCIRDGLKGLRDSVKPAHIFSDTYEKITGEAPKKEGRGFAGGIFKTALALLLGKVILKAEERAEQRVYETVDLAFDKLKDLIGKKFGGNKNRPEQPADDEAFE